MRTDNTPGLDRRAFLGTAAASAAWWASPSAVWAQQAVLGQAPTPATRARVVVVGGGVGGATAAKYLKLFNPALEVTLIEKNPVYIRPYGSTEVLNQHVGMDDLVVRYDDLQRTYGVQLLTDTVVGLDSAQQVVITAGKRRVPYDRLIVSPGIELIYNAYEGYSEAVAQSSVPSGWIPGTQTALLAKQLQTMRPGGTFVLAAPPNPYRCPPGPYERVALMAEWFGKHNPSAKILLLDPKDSFVTDQTMLLGWNRLYRFNLPDDYAQPISAKAEVKTHAAPGMITWVRGKEGGRTLRVDGKRMQIETEVQRFAADVINVIPPMKAAAVARSLGLTDASGWCPVDRRTFASTQVPHVHVIGDASIADAMPKSGFSANNQAKVVARAIVETLAGRETPEPLWENTCYALAGKDYGLFVADVFRIVEGKIARINTKARYLPLDASPMQIKLGARYQQAWLRTFTQDCFA